MKRLLFYCQHVLGMGHFMRSATLVQALAQDFEICFLNGGEIIAGFVFPPGIKIVNLPPIKSDESFKHIESTQGQELDEVKLARVAQILAVVDQWQPDVVVIELYPFGRKKFSFELLPLSARIRSTLPQTKVVCSLRDILVSRPEQEGYEAQVCDLLNRYFDLLLVHADPQFQRLEETFSAVSAIKIPIRYTGYVAQSESGLGAQNSLLDADGIELDDKLPLVLASIGGGRVGYELLVAAVEASVLLHTSWPHQLLLFSGPYLEEEKYLLLQQLTLDKPHILVHRFTSHFLAYMARGALSISMAGYNTCMNILTTGVRALTLPFTGGDNNEQTIRAGKLAAYGLVTVLQPEDLRPERLQARMIESLQTQPTTSALRLNGSIQTTTQLVALVQEGDDARSINTGGNLRHTSSFDAIERKLRPYLERLHDEKQLQLFLRDDDVDEEEETLRQLLDIAVSRGVPLNLAIIPTRLTAQGTRLLKSFKKQFPALFELHQHGWQHLNHEKSGRKCEFGPSRPLEEQREDISRGKMLLEQALGRYFFPAFTPPWNRCTSDTLTVLDELNFKVLSQDSAPSPLSSHTFREISITFDFMAKGTLTMRPPAELLEELVRQIQSGAPIGIMLHHKNMDNEAFAFLDRLLAELVRSPFVHFYTFSELHGASQIEAVQSNHQEVLLG